MDLLFAVHAILSEAFGKGVGVDLQLCDLKAATKKGRVRLVRVM